MAAESVYALVQVAHNFRAVVGSPAAAWPWIREQGDVPIVLAWLTVVGWLVQSMSGIGFGITSYLSRGELPEVTGVALIALYIKVTCAVAGFIVAAFYLLATPARRMTIQRLVWQLLVAVGIAALGARRIAHSPFVPIGLMQ